MIHRRSILSYSLLIGICFQAALALLVSFFSGAAVAETVVYINDGFESYTNTLNLWQTWVPRHANGTGTPDPIDDGILVNAAQANAVYPGSFPNGGPGHAVDHIGEQAGTPPNTSILQYEGGNGFGPGLIPLLPTSTKNIVLAGDIYFDGIGGKRMSIGLRSNVGENIVELGFYSGGSVMNNLGQHVFLAFAHRLVVFPGPGEPNWVYPALPLGFDSDADGVTEVFEIGAAWHRFQATIGLTEIVMELDLYNDGMTRNTQGMDIEGPDVVTTYALGPDTFTISSLGFDSLRLGGPSGVSSPNGGVLYDNIYLALEDIAPLMNNADFDHDGDVDGRDFLIWQRGGSPNGINSGDLALWQSQYGTPLAATNTAVPEPASTILITYGIFAAIFTRKYPAQKRIGRGNSH